MSVVVTVRHKDDVSAAVQNYARDKGESLARAFAKVEHVHVILAREKHLSRVEVVIQAKNHNRVDAKHASENPRASIDAAFERGERQLKKFRDKARDRRPKTDGIEPERGSSEEQATGADQ
ncbi:MAG: HPF/RaiA family ribosome-associated protein [Verrucomicrobiota bacterium]|nr:HPF/RaiA family ribosome-associated protein [Verrucomicrobiota bacterium]